MINSIFCRYNVILKFRRDSHTLRINAIDVIYSNQSLDMDVNNIIRNNVIPLTNQITTLLIIITILLLPIINIGG